MHVRAPCSNATLERIFSRLRVVKSVWCNRLSEENLMHLLRIKVTGPSLEIFHNDYCNTTIDKWYNDKNRRLGQNKRKNIEKGKQTKNKEVNLSCHHYLKQVARVKKVITIFNLIVCENIFLYLCNFIFETQN